MMLEKTRSRSKARKSKKNKAHLARVAQLPCIVCGSTPVTCHHIRHGQGMGQKAPDEETLPLCYLHHQGKLGIHKLGTRKWEMEYGREIDLLEKVRKMLG